MHKEKFSPKNKIEQVVVPNENIVSWSERIIAKELTRLGVSDVEEKVRRAGMSNTKFVKMSESANALGLFLHKKWFSNIAGQENKEIVIDDSQSVFIKFSTHMHEAVHAMSATENETGLVDAGLYMALNEGLTEHVTLHLLRNGKEYYPGPDFEIQMKRAKELGGYRPYVYLWNEWIVKIARKNLQEGELLQDKMMQVRDFIYKLYFDGRTSDILAIVNEVDPGAIDVYANLYLARPKTVEEKESEYIKQIKSYFAATEAVGELRDNNSVISGLSKNIYPPGILAKKYLQEGIYSELAVFTHYFTVLCKHFGGRDFFANLMSLEFDSESVDFLKRFLENLNNDLRDIARSASKSDAAREKFPHEHLEKFAAEVEAVLAICTDWRFIKLQEDVKIATKGRLTVEQKNESEARIIKNINSLPTEADLPLFQRKYLHDILKEAYKALKNSKNTE